MKLFWNRYIVIAKPLAQAVCLLILAGCSFRGENMFSKALPLPPAPTPSAASGFETLTWRGGIAVLAGLGLLVISSGRKGWYPLLIGIGLILLNWIVLTYAHALFLPVVVTTGILTLAIGYKILATILIDRKNRKCI